MSKSRSLNDPLHCWLLQPLYIVFSLLLFEAWLFAQYRHETFELEIKNNKYGAEHWTLFQFLALDIYFGIIGLWFITSKLCIENMDFCGMFENYFCKDNKNCVLLYDF